MNFLESLTYSIGLKYILVRLAFTFFLKKYLKL